MILANNCKYHPMWLCFINACNYVYIHNLHNLKYDIIVKTLIQVPISCQTIQIVSANWSKVVQLFMNHLLLSTKAIALFASNIEVLLIPTKDIDFSFESPTSDRVCYFEPLGKSLEACGTATNQLPGVVTHASLAAGFP